MSKAGFRACSACGGRGYQVCDCWPGDCVCALGDVACEGCGGEGVIDTTYEDDILVVRSGCEDVNGADERCPRHPRDCTCLQPASVATALIGIDLGSPEGDGSVYFTIHKDGRLEIITPEEFAAIVTSGNGGGE